MTGKVFFMIAFAIAILGAVASGLDYNEELDDNLDPNPGKVIFKSL